VSGPPRVKVIRFGPYLVTGGVALRKLERDEEDRWTERTLEDPGERYTLCRCGRTSRPPWCDNSHAPGSWDAQPRLVSVPRPVSWEATDDEPGVAIKPNGPLRVRGVELSADDGTVFEPADRCSLCRCGRSNTMPFCDGTHKKVGFRG
jgi:CDGSH-type Zn-finger protein